MACLANLNSINNEQRLFVFNEAGGYTCLGFDVVFKRLRQYVRKIGGAAPVEAEKGTEKQLREYFQAESAFIRSNPQETFFEDDTPLAVRDILERCRLARTPVRIYLGDTQTGRDWMEEWDTVGRIGRSCGAIKIPLMIVGDEDGGGALLSSSIVRIQHARIKKDLWVHPAYHQPAMTLVDSTVQGFAKEVMVEGKVHARFKKEASALRWMDFMKGERRGK